LKHLFLGSLDSGFRNLTGFILLDHRLDDADSDGLTHVTDSKATKRRIVSEGLDTHGLGWHHLDDRSITRLDELGGGLSRFAGTAIDLLQELRELAGNVGSVAIQDWSVSSTDLTGVVEDDDLGIEGLGTLGRVVLGVTSDVATTDFLNRNVLDIEADVVTWETLDKLLVVHLDGLDFGGDTGGGEGDNHARFDHSSFNTAYRYSPDSSDLVHILEGKAKRLVGWAGWWVDGINSLEEGLAGGLGLGLLLPSLVPWAVGRVVDHIVTVEARDGDEGDVLGVVADFLDEVGRLLDNLIEAVLRPLGGVHFVDGDDELLDTEGVGEQSVLTSLAILGDTGLELTSTSGDDENGAISLGGTRDHVLDEITVTRGVDDGDIVLWGFELPESNVDGDTTLALGLQFVENPCILEGTLAEFGSFLLKLLNGTLVNTAALVDQVTSGSGLAGVDMADNDYVDVELLFSHIGGCVVLS